MAAELNARTRARILDGAMRGHRAPRPDQARHERRERACRRLARHRCTGTSPAATSCCRAWPRSRASASSSASAMRCATRPPDAARLRVALQHVAALRQRASGDPAHDRDRAGVRAALSARAVSRRCARPRDRSFAPLLGETRSRCGTGVASAEQLVDWLTRMMISAVLFPDPDPDAHGARPDRGLPPAGCEPPPRRRARAPARNKPERNGRAMTTAWRPPTSCSAAR